MVQTLENAVSLYKKLNRKKSEDTVLINSIQTLMKISERILKRLNAIKRGDITIRDDNVKQVEKLNEFKTDVSNILRSVKKKKTFNKCFKKCSSRCFEIKKFNK